MLITYKTEYEARAHETRGHILGDARNAEGRTSGLKAARVRDLRHDCPDLGDVDDEGGWLLLAITERNTMFGFRSFVTVCDAAGDSASLCGRIDYFKARLAHEVDAAIGWGLLPARQQDEWYQGSTAPLRKLAEEVIRGVVHDAISAANGMPRDADEVVARARHFGQLLQEVRITSWRQWGPSPNEAHICLTHDLDKLWRTLSLDEAALPHPAQTDAAYFAERRARRGY